MMAAQAKILEAEILGAMDRALKRVPDPQRDLVLATEYYGLNGHPPKSLAACGRAAGLTRERVRQVCARSCGLAAAQQRRFPVLDAVLRRMAALVPCTMADVEKVLLREGRIGSRHVLPHLRLLAAALGRASMVRKPAVAALWKDRAGEGRWKVQLRRALARSSVHSRSSVERILAKLSPEISPAEALDAFVSSSSWRFVGKDREWLMRVKGGRIPHLVRAIRETLAVTRRLPVDRLRLEAPPWKPPYATAHIPAPALLILAEEFAGLRVEGNVLIAPAALRPEDVLPPRHLRIWRCMRDQDGVAYGRTLARLFRSGMSNPHVYLQGVRWLRRAQRGVWTFLNTPPAAVERLLAPAREQREIRKGLRPDVWGRLPDGRLWVAGHGHFHRASFPLPEAFCKELRGAMTVTLPGSAAEMTVRCKGLWCHHGHAVACAGVAIRGKYRLVVFDPARETVEYRAGTPRSARPGTQGRGRRTTGITPGPIGRPSRNRAGT